MERVGAVAAHLLAPGELVKVRAVTSFVQLQTCAAQGSWELHISVIKSARCLDVSYAASQLQGPCLMGRPPGGPSRACVPRGPPRRPGAPLCAPTLRPPSVWRFRLMPRAHVLRAISWERRDSPPGSSDRYHCRRDPEAWRQPIAAARADGGDATDPAVPSIVVILP